MSNRYIREWDSDSELGFIGAATSAVGGAVKGLAKIGKVFKQKHQKKKAKGHITTLPVQNIEGQAKAKIRKAARGLNPDDREAIVREVVAAIPGPVRQIVLEALRASQANTLQAQAQMDALTGQVDSALKPDIAAMLAVLQAQRVSGQATYEHNELVARQEFRTNTRDKLADLSDRLARMEARLKLSAIVPPGRVALYGNRNVLEG